MNLKDKHLHRSVDEIDATIFSGDAMHDKEDRKEFRRMMERWERELKSFDRMDEEEIPTGWVRQDGSPVGSSTIFDKK